MQEEFYLCRFAAAGKAWYTEPGDSMVYFATGMMKHKLIILYFMCEADFEMTQDQIFCALAENGWMDFFDFRTTFLELEEDEYVQERARSFGRAYSVTVKGKEAVELFSESLPESFRMAVNAYIQEYGEELRRQTQFSVRMTNLPDGGQQVRLKALDENAVLLDLSFRVPDSVSAQRACESWPKEAADIYQYILNKLIMEK